LIYLAPQVGLEPTTLRLTAEWLVAASRRNRKTYTRQILIVWEIGDALGILREKRTGTVRDDYY
jgi:hypothetical protein